MAPPVTLRTPQKNAGAPPTAREVAVRIKGVRKAFGDTPALEHIDLDVYEGEFLSLLGPSGCGKTTLLRIIAGFEEPDVGTVQIGGRDALPLPPHKRPVNTVFQSYALFPHMNVLDNILFGLKMSRAPKREALSRAQGVMAMVDIEGLGGRKPHQLSGGQRQRVALARALVNAPKVLLLDEPLGALDVQLRKQLQLELCGLQRRVGITFIYVTHDQEEALVMSDRIAVMRAGLIDQLGPVSEMYERPKTRYAATFLGNSNLLEGSVRRVSEGIITVDTPHGPVLSSVMNSAMNSAMNSGTGPSGQVTLSIRPEKIDLVRDPVSHAAVSHAAVSHPVSPFASPLGKANVLRGVVKERVYSGAATHYLIGVGEQVMSAYVMNKAQEDEVFEVGEALSLVIPYSSVVPLDD
jgi:spermidine/putrescine transport system ATP-binding protein